MRKYWKRRKSGRFVVVGVPRSGTTYLATLLNSHPLMECSGEQYNPYAIVGHGKGERNTEGVFERDRAPKLFFEEFFRKRSNPDKAQIGFKYMLGHNIQILDYLADHDDVSIIYVYRENRLAQASSFIKAIQDKQWATINPDKVSSDKLEIDFRRLSHRWHELASLDTLFAGWLARCDNRHITVEYRQLFKPDFNARICKFLGVDMHPDMKSALLKQNANSVVDRFENAEEISRYFTALGHADWLAAEINDAV